MSDNEQMTIFDGIDERPVLDEFGFSPRTQEWSEAEREKLHDSVKGFNKEKDGA